MVNATEALDQGVLHLGYFSERNVAIIELPIVETFGYDLMHHVLDTSRRRLGGRVLGFAWTLR